MICLRNLSKKRKEKGMTQSELEIKAKLPDGTISQIETGRREPGIAVVVKIAKCLNCKVDDLL